MAGAGYKLFNTGDVLTAAQVNTYLNEQTVMVFASSAARTSALSGVLAEGMMSYLQDTNAVEVYNGSAWVGVSGAGDVTEVQAGTGISVASGTGPIPVVTNTMATAFDAAGDLVYGTGADTFTKLSLGTANQVLTVNAGATAPEWKTAGGGSGLVLIKRASFSSVANTGTTFDNVFSASYTNYFLSFESVSASTLANDLHMQLRTSGPATRATNYKSATLEYSDNNATPAIVNNPNDDFWLLALNTYGSGYLNYNNTYLNCQGFYYSEVGYKMYIIQAQNGAGGSPIGFILKSSSSNISGTVAVYGLAQA